MNLDNSDICKDEKYDIASSEGEAFSMLEICTTSWNGTFKTYNFKKETNDMQCLYAIIIFDHVSKGIKWTYANY